MKKQSLAIVLGLFLSSTVVAGEFYGITMPDTKKVGEKNLVLNGMALRQVYKFGFPVKVYVAGLYLPKKSQSTKEIVESKEVRQLVMEYKRGIDRDNIVDGWSTGFSNACIVDCENWKTRFSEFKKLITSVGKGDKMILTFHADHVEIESVGTTPKKGVIQSEAFVQNLMNIFVSEKNPPSPRFRNEILSIDKK